MQLLAGAKHAVLNDECEKNVVRQIEEFTVILYLVIAASIKL